MVFTYGSLKTCEKGQSGDFYRKFAWAFEDIARDIEDGQEPDPHNICCGRVSGGDGCPTDGLSHLPRSNGRALLK